MRLTFKAFGIDPFKNQFMAFFQKMINLQLKAIFGQN